MSTAPLAEAREELGISRDSMQMQAAPSFNEYTLQQEEEQQQKIKNSSTTVRDVQGGGFMSPLSQTLWKKESTAGNPIVGAWLTWNNITVNATTNGETTKLLQGITGYAEPGYISAIMGPSGSGKSTLLDALAGRLAQNTVLSGEVLVNGRKMKLSYGSAAYVSQEDSLVGTLTVRESIYYSAHLRLADNMAATEKKSIVEGTILEMGLQDCADTPIGNWHLRGVSGGERRRVSIAMEILMRPRLLFLDEPTSGLDSAAAFFVIQTLRNLARDGRTVLCSIHQPSSEVFDLFDNLFLLSGGKTVYFGQADDANEFFTRSGFPCPPRRNPSDHFLRCVNNDFDCIKATLKGSFNLRDNFQDPLERYTTTQVIGILTNTYQTSEYAMATAARVYEIAQVKGTILESRGSQASFLMQSVTLTKRSFVNMTRDVGYYWLRLIIYIVVAICVGSIYFNVGTGYDAILARGSCASFVSGFVTFMSIGGFPSFVEDMKVFQRERLNGHYGVLPFVVANTISSMPYLAMITVSAGTICYYMAGLRPGFSHYIFFILTLFACVSVVESLMMAIATVIPNFLMGIITGSGILGIFMLVAGFFRLPNDLPKPFWRYPMSYISYNYWALQGQYKNDLIGIAFENKIPGLPPIEGEYVASELFQIDMSRSKWWDLSILFVNIVAYRLIFFLIIKFNEKVTPYLRAFYAKHSIKRSRPVAATSLSSLPPNSLR